MSVPLAYIGVIAIWSTTPLAIKWSGEGPGFLLGVTGRMAIGALLCLLLINLLRKPLPWHKQARQAYVAATMATFLAMLSVYAGAQYISSGLTAVLFGLTPLITALFAHWLLKERCLTPEKIAGTVFALVGLVVIFAGNGLAGHTHLWLGASLVLLATTFHSLSTVLVKKVNSDLPGITVTTGALVVTLPLFFMTWLIFDGTPPVAIPVHAGVSILYLGLVGSVIGYTLYYYVLRHSMASTAGLIPLVTPVMALVIGNLVNDELFSSELLVGTGLILVGLALHQWGRPLVMAVSTRRGLY